MVPATCRSASSADAPDAELAAIRHHLALDPGAQFRVDAVEAGLDQLEAFEIGGQRELHRGRAVAAAMRGETLAQRLHREVDRRRSHRRERLGMRAQPPLRLRGVRAEARG